MAKTKTQIKGEINNRFVTNGNIRAVDTSATLKDILDCTELNDKGDLVGIENRLNSVESVNLTQNSRLTFLEQNNRNSQDLFSIEITHQDSNVDAFFSFRGIYKHFVNITFRIRVTESFQDGKIIFSNNQLPELKSLLEGIIDQKTNQMLNFLVTITNIEMGNTIFRIGNLNLHFIDDQTLGVRILNYQNEPSGMKNGDEIYTSIALHSHYNDKAGRIANNLKNRKKDFEDLFTPTNNPKGTVVLPPSDKVTVTRPVKDVKTNSVITKTKEVNKPVSSIKVPVKKTTTSRVKIPINKQTITATKPKEVTQNPTKPTRKK